MRISDWSSDVCSSDLFKIVFVGYSADDPPVQYLLEALNRSEDRPNGLYAFQAGEIAQATEQWAHKGVCPLPYSSANQHAALWDTLGAWAERARDVDRSEEHTSELQSLMRISYAV